MTADPHRLLLGESRTPVLTVDDLPSDRAGAVALAAALAPFPPARNNYPGLRRVIDERDQGAWRYVVDLLEAATPYVAGAFDLDGFDLVEASFSLVTTPPARLAPAQRAPHFDSVDPEFYALMHYLAPCAGTAFYRHRTSGTEVVTPATVDEYVASAKRDAASMAPDYFRGGDTAYECLGVVEGRAGRVVAYPGRLLHSGVIPSGFEGSADPREGRLTCNIFIKGRRNG